MDTIFNHDKKLQLIREYLEKRITPEEINERYAVDKNTIDNWINQLFREADRFFGNENFINDIEQKIKKMSEMIREKEKIISCLERDNYELKKIIYTFGDEEE